ncbi:Uncharacterised protein [Brucella suis]|nr:hypothetical protein DO74_2 [Brucella abortus bv. 6 str. 870]SPU78524.1 Uncharacterised protein [Brucella suis]
MAFRGENVKPACGQSLFLQLGDIGLDRGDLLFAFGAFRHIGKFLANAHFQIAAKLDIGTATGHVGGDGDGARHTGLCDNVGFLLVIAGVEDLKPLDAFTAQALG